MRQQKQKQNNGFLCCCGLLPRNPDKENRNGEIDSFNCALKKGILLIQGKMVIEYNALKFYSSFSTASVFKSTEIVVPKSEIIKIIKDRYISMMIVVNTLHGNLEFTSFLMDPF